MSVNLFAVLLAGAYAAVLLAFGPVPVPVAAGCGVAFGVAGLALAIARGWVR